MHERAAAPELGAPPGRLLFALGMAVWLASFALLLRLGTWIQFAVAGVALAGLAVATDPDTRALLRPSRRSAAIGLCAGVLLTVLTHAAFALATWRTPEVRAATDWLFRLAYSDAIALPARALLIMVIAGSEEVVFRGTLLGALPARGARALQPLGRGDLLRIVTLSAAYALSMLTLGSALLVACAFACGVAWAGLRVATRSLIAPIVAHVVWDLGVLIMWPLVELRG